MLFNLQNGVDSNIFFENFLQQEID